MKNRLYFFTSSYPFGHGESFIENEIIYLTKAFDQITIIPLYCYNTNSIIRTIPNNCKSLHPIIRSKFQHYFIGLFGLRTINLFIKDFFNASVYKNFKRLKMFLINFCTANNLLQSKTLKK